MEQLIVEGTISDKLHDIVYRISTNDALKTDSGLNGKMGTAIILYHYGRCYKKTACTQLANSFIEHVRNNIAVPDSIDYISVLTGIEAGFLYLLKNGFIDTAAAEMPETVQQAFQKNLNDFPRENILEYFHSLSALGKFFTQDHRIASLTTIGPFSDFNKKSIWHFIRLLWLLDAEMIPQLDHKYILRVIDALSRIYSNRFLVKESQELIKLGLQVLELILFDKSRFKPFTAGCNPFNIALTLLSIYYRTHNPDFAALAIHLLEEYEGAINELYLMKEIPNAELLQHIIACNKLHTLLKSDTFKNYGQKSLDLYNKRKNIGNNDLQSIDKDDFSLQSGYAGEGMALLTLEGNIHLEWIEDLLGYY